MRSASVPAGRSAGLLRQLLLCAAPLGVGLVGVVVPWSATPAQTAPAAVPVGTVLAARKPITASDEFVGRVEAVKRVEISARVVGFLQAVLFKEGELLKEGAPLFRIEREPFEAAVAAGAGRADKGAGAICQRRRAAPTRRELLKSSAGSVATRDQRRPRLKRPRAMSSRREANLTDGEYQSRLHRHHSADHRADRPHQRDQGQRCRPGQRALAHDRQPGSDVRRLSR